MNIEDIRTAVASGGFRYRNHARRRMAQLGIDRSDVFEAILAGEIIEEYRGHYWGACCLVYGESRDGRHLHIVLSTPPRVWIITVYEPDPEQWIDFRIRR